MQKLAISVSPSGHSELSDGMNERIEGEQEEAESRLKKVGTEKGWASGKQVPKGLHPTVHNYRNMYN